LIGKRPGKGLRDRVETLTQSDSVLARRSALESECRKGYVIGRTVSVTAGLETSTPEYAPLTYRMHDREESDMSDDSSLLKIAQASLITGSATITVSVLSLAKSKTIALLQGTDGIGLLGQFTSFQSLLGGIAALGLSLGLIKYVSQHFQAGDHAQVRRFWSSAVTLTIVSSIVVMASMLIFAGPVSRVLVGNDSGVLYVRIVSLSVPLFALSTLYNGLINGARAIKSLAAMAVTGALGSLVIAAPAVYYLGKDGVIVQLALSALTLVFINFAVARRVFGRWQVSAKVADFGRREAGMLLKFGMFSLTTTLLIPAVMLFTQTFVIKTEGVSENGLFQAAWALFWLYIGFATASFSTYIFPTMSATESVGDLTRQVDNSLRFLTVMTTPVSCAIVLFPTQILGILYTSEFSGAATLLQILAIATCFRVLSLPMAFAYVAKGHLKEYLLFEVSWHAIFMGIVVAALAQTGIVVIGVATLTAYAVYSALAMALGRRIVGVRYSSRNMMSFALSLTVLVITLAAYLMVDYSAIPIGVAGIAMWFLATTRREERQWLKSHVLRLGKG